MLRKKKKSPKASNAEQKSSSSSSIVMIVALLILLIYLCANYYMRFAVTHSRDTEQFEEVMKKARSLAMKYKNLTGFSPPFEMALRGRPAATQHLASISSAQASTPGVSTTIVKSQSTISTSSSKSKAVVGKKDILIGM